MKEKELLADSFYEERRITPKWRQGVLPNAGVWMADGGFQVAVYGSAAEAALRERGALLVASVLFDRSHADRPVRGDVSLDLYPTEALSRPGTRRAIDALGWTADRN